MYYEDGYLLHNLNRRCFECFPETDHNFFKKENEKKMGRNDRYKKVYQARFCLVQKVSTRHKSTFFRLLAHGML